jgi:tetratricopeptide (TPR) repeat protein
MSLPAGVAYENLKQNKTSKWPDGRRDTSRLAGVVSVDFEPTFTIEPGEAIFTVGSCFARNIERRFSVLGFKIPALEISLPEDERASDVLNDILNKYPPHSILNEFRWALDPEHPFQDASYLQMPNGRWHDPHLAGNVRPASLDRVKERRAMVEGIYRQAASCRVVVVTLGLVEAWLDNATGFYLNEAPPKAVVLAEPNRFSFQILSVDEIMEALESLHALLTRFGHPEFRILATVSPVPFKATFTGRDALLANTYSKSALRVALEMFSLRHQNVDYFPSYEIVTLTNRSAAFIQDNRHVNSNIVDEIVDSVIGAYCPKTDADGEAGDSRRGRARLKELLEQENWLGAATIYQGLARQQRYERWGMTPFNFHFDFGRALLRGGALAQAHTQLALAAEIDPQSLHAAYNLGILLAKLQRPLEAEEHLRRAVDLKGATVEHRRRLAAQLEGNGKTEEAEFQRSLADAESQGSAVDPRVKAKARKADKIAALSSKK